MDRLLLKKEMTMQNGSNIIRQLIEQIVLQC
jgi:hypothetical protein